ncbi:MAG: class I SAM-dependent methyltransferase [bacterium]|nr:class I SAM-dependent methyltransferase [bacterium]
MERQEYLNIYKHESDHFFYTSLHSLVVSILNKYSQKNRVRRILDVGCGTGGLAAKLQLNFQVEGVDIHPLAVTLARNRRIKARQGSVEKLPKFIHLFDAVTCIDVIYHKRVKNDVRALTQLARVVKKGGLLVLRVPAGDRLTAHDVHVHTKRKYTITTLIPKLIKAGWKVKFISYVHFLPWIIYQLLPQPLSSKSAVTSLPYGLNTLAKFWLSLESSWLLANKKLPVGLGIIAVAEKL